MKEDRSDFVNNLLRHGKMTGAMASLAMKVAGERFLGVKIDRPEHAESLVRALSGLRGPVMKVGQILATVPDALPPEYSEAFRQLQATAPSMGKAFVRRRMKGELGFGWEKNFASFDYSASAAASLGQVHKAVTDDGRELACKLQYPNMLSAVEADLSQLKVIFSIFERYDKSIDTKYIHEELSDRLFEELDYNLEAKYCRLYAKLLEKEDCVVVPEVVDELSTKRLLTSTWLDGGSILDSVKDSQERRNRIAKNMFRLWFIPFFHYGIIHGDPHLGNYTVRDDDSINLLDFGCVRIFPSMFVEGVVSLYKALLNNDYDLSVHAYETWGFKNLSKDQVEVLNIWARFLYAPLLEDKVCPIGETTGGFYGREVAAKVHEKLRETGTVVVPREFVFLDRAALGLGSVFLHLKAEVNWHKVFVGMAGDFDAKSVEARQQGVLSKCGLSVR